MLTDTMCDAREGIRHYLGEPVFRAIYRKDRGRINKLLPLLEAVIHLYACPEEDDMLEPIRDALDALDVSVVAAAVASRQAACDSERAGFNKGK